MPDTSSYRTEHPLPIDRLMLVCNLCNAPLMFRYAVMNCHIVAQVDACRCVTTDKEKGAGKSA